jgi:hypothetical protein
MENVRTVELHGVKYSTHPFDEYNGDGVSLTNRFAELREEYEKDGKEIISMQTYYNSGYNSATDKIEGEPEFGIEVEHL